MASCARDQKGHYSGFRRVLGARPVNAFDVQITEIKIDNALYWQPQVFTKLRDTCYPINPQYFNDIDNFQSQTQSNTSGRMRKMEDYECETYKSCTAVRPLYQLPLYQPWFYPWMTSSLSLSPSFPFVCFPFQSQSQASCMLEKTDAI